MTVVSAAMVAFGVAPVLPSHAAGGSAISISENAVRVGVGETAVIAVEYEGLPQGSADISVLSSDSSIVEPAIVDAGDGQLSLAVAGNGIGTATVAVYSLSNIQAVDYVVVQSGMAKAGEIINMEGEQALATIYSDMVIHYGRILIGRNGAELAVTGLALERGAGIDCLSISGELLAKDGKMPGMTVFYADFYDAAGGLIKRQAVYTRDSRANSHMELQWYVPEGCARVDLQSGPATQGGRNEPPDAQTAA